MKRRLLRLTGVGRWVESNGDGFRCLKETDARPFSVMESSHAKTVASIIETMKRRLLQLTVVFEWEGG
jgi:hypothetical protein